MPDSTAQAAAFTAQLTALREQFCRDIGTTVDEMVARTNEQEASSELLRELHGRLHKLVGSGGSFGFADLSRQARLLEVAARHWLDDKLPAAAEWAAWKLALQALRQTVALPTLASASAPALQPPGKPRESLHITLIEDDLAGLPPPGATA